MAAMKTNPLLLERLRLIEALTDVNSRHLLGERHCAGAEIALFAALERETRDGASTALCTQISALRRALDVALHEQAQLADARTQLEQALSDLDHTDGGVP
jgi:hypothetical protein